MSWARIDDTLYDHPKLDRLGRDRLAGVGLQVLAISWSNRFLTDGFVPEERIPRLGGTLRLAEKLVEAGMWERVAEGFHIHDFHAYSKSRARVLLEREGARERQAAHRGMSQRDIVRSHDEVTQKSHVPRPVPVPEPVTTVRETGPEPAAVAARRTLDALGIRR